MPRRGASFIRWIAEVIVSSAMLGSLPIFVHCDSCIKTSSCSCIYENGSYIDLSPLNSGGLYPRFKDVIEVTGGAWDSWNPCGSFSEGSCYNVAVCRVGPILSDMYTYYNLGTQDSAEFIADNGTFVIQYAQTTDVLRVASILLTCDKTTEGQLIAYGLEENNGVLKYRFELRSLHACLVDPLHCSQKSPCSCQFDNGKVVDLSPLDTKTGIPRFKDILSLDNKAWYSWNPCSSFAEGGCQTVAVCEIGPIVPNPDYIDLGNQDSSWFHAETGQLILSYHDPTNTRRVNITLLCDGGRDGDLTISGPINSTSDIKMELRSKYVCPTVLPSLNWKKSSTLVASDETSKNGSRMITKETVPDRPMTTNLKNEHRSTIIVTETAYSLQGIRDLRQKTKYNSPSLKASDRLRATRFLSKWRPTYK